MNMLEGAQPPGSKLKIQVWIDFVCPYCLLGKKSLEAAVEGLDVEIEMMPFELREYPTPTLRPEDEYLPSAWKYGVYPAAEKMGISIKLPSVSPQPYTRDSLLVLQYAKEHGLGNEYAEAMLKAFFQEKLDIGEFTVIRDVAASVGLPTESLQEILESAARGQRHDKELEYAQQIGIRAVPSMAIGQKVYSGMLDAQKLREVIISSIS
ncbi:DsbA family oxidoreductase [Pseudomonas putida]|uniref:2-hydroxychromene-2-carboxylate isomerase n=1 Tax=Pseudomonas putida TaxID=303 RepID=A0A7V8J149_PSEPU|nr:DsbA family oxidoreductase [Pseudomonas putida]KAF0251209.1 2-hydroxychromene-2-carboxylate isomerase [Pseudomonas putida]